MASTILKQKMDRPAKRRTVTSRAANQGMPKKTVTTDAVAIIYKRYIEGRPELETYLVEERERNRIANQVYDLRVNAKMTHAVLAKKVGVTAAEIRDLEESDYEGHQLPLLRKIAAVFGKRIAINFVPLDKKEKRTTPPLPRPKVK
jgi:DNA-binding XRE family transcriptional regulator